MAYKFLVREFAGDSNNHTDKWTDANHIDEVKELCQVLGMRFKIIDACNNWKQYVKDVAAGKRKPPTAFGEAPTIQDTSGPGFWIEEENGTKRFIETPREKSKIENIVNTSQATPVTPDAVPVPIPVKISEPKYFTKAGIEFKLDGEDLYSREWVDTDMTEYRIVNTVGDKLEIAICDLKVQKLEWVKT